MNIPSPCVRVCQIENNICVGCMRSLGTISNWTSMSNQERLDWWDGNAQSFAGIGSRDTPVDRLERMRKWSSQLPMMLLRSGAARGADKAFEEKARRKEIYISERKPYHPKSYVALHELPLEIVQQARFIAKQQHRGWDGMANYKQDLLARNVLQLLGSDLISPVRMVLCWAPNPKLDTEGRLKNAEGGTGLAIRVAYSLGIPILHADIHTQTLSLLEEGDYTRFFKKVHEMRHGMCASQTGPIFSLKDVQQELTSEPEQNLPHSAREGLPRFWRPGMPR